MKDFARNLKISALVTIGVVGIAGTIIGLATAGPIATPVALIAYAAFSLRQMAV